MSDSTLPSTVNPSARYHVSDVSLEHGATEFPAGWRARCSTSPPPPSSSTTTLTNGAVASAETSMVFRDHGSTVKSCVAATPSGVSTLNRPTSWSPARFETTTSPPTPSSPEAGTPGQNQLPVSLSVSLTCGIQLPDWSANVAGSAAGVSRPTTNNAVSPRIT